MEMKMKTETIGTETFTFSAGYADVHAYIRTLRINVKIMAGDPRHASSHARDTATIARYERAVR